LARKAVGMAKGAGGRSAHKLAAVFLDRDGVLVRDANWLRDVGQLRLMPGAAAAVKRLNDRGIPVVLVTNQSVVARGWLTLEGLAKIHAEMERRLARLGAHLDGIYICPHHATEGVGEFRRRCCCRKPEPGMLLQAAEEMGLPLAETAIIGDKLSDLEAGRRVGCTTVLVLSGQGRAHYREARKQGREHLADAVCTTLTTAVEWCLEERG
jgi:D-glycero-D-manno-heptose 1,7-bisphosphate phosphatase